MNNSYLHGALLALAGFTTFALGDVVMKLAGMDGVSIALIAFISGLAGSSSLCLYAMAKGEIKTILPKNLKFHGIIALMFLAMSFVGTLAFTNLPMTTAYIGYFCSPFLITLLGKIFLKEMVSLKQVFAILVGFVGVVMALIPEITSEANYNSAGDTTTGYLCLAAAVSIYVISMILLRIYGPEESAISVSFSAHFGRVIFLFPVLFLLPLSEIELSSFLYMAGMGICGGMGFAFMSAAYRLAPVAVTSPFHYTQLITGALAGYLIWHDMPSYWVFVGGTVIAISGILVAREAQRLERLKNIQLSS